MKQLYPTIVLFFTVILAFVAFVGIPVFPKYEVHTHESGSSVADIYASLYPPLYKGDYPVNAGGGLIRQYEPPYVYSIDNEWLMGHEVQNLTYFTCFVSSTKHVEFLSVRQIIRLFEDAFVYRDQLKKGYTPQNCV